MELSIQEINEKVRQEAVFVQDLQAEIRKIIVGQDRLIQRLLIGLLADGHILIEGVPGLAKTLAVKTLSDAIQASFQRLQFTPDLLPADLIGTQVYNPRTGEFTPRQGPIFANLILADEINRAPAKVQSALLEAMQERQVTIGDTTYPLDKPFLVLATQNPIEQEGTYPLPEAQVDRFMLKVVITYPNRDEERVILQRMTGEALPPVQPIIALEQILHAREVARGIYVDSKVQEYVLDLVFATREPEEHGLDDLRLLIDYGASPRATIYLIAAAKAHAFLQGRGYVTPEDVKQMATDVLQHRVIVTYEAEAEEITAADVVRQILDQVQVP
ncbi:MAG: AAA domain-containing protein [Chloroflexi bacterium]|nr:AAA domain-containing protein [Chloroflexota bacterium]